MNTLSWALKLFSLIPLISSGVHQIQGDLSDTHLKGKLTAAQDALDFASAGSIALLPTQDRALATSIAQTASTALASTITALHAQGAPQPILN